MPVGAAGNYLTAAAVLLHLLLCLTVPVRHLRGIRDEDHLHAEKDPPVVVNNVINIQPILGINLNIQPFQSGIINLPEVEPGIINLPPVEPRQLTIGSMSTAPTGLFPAIKDGDDGTQQPRIKELTPATLMIIRRNPQ